MSTTTSAEQNADMRLRCINAITPAVFAMHAQGAKADDIIWVLEWAMTQLKPTGIFASLMAEGGGPEKSAPHTSHQGPQQ
jgi:hypothetical protein